MKKITIQKKFNKTKPEKNRKKANKKSKQKIIIRIYSQYRTGNFKFLLK